MSVIATLVGGTAGLRAEDLDAAEAALRGEGVAVETVEWLAPDLACDLHLSTAAEALVRRALDRGLDGRTVDYAVQRAADRSRRLLVADLESTIIRNEMLDDLGARIGAGEEIARITRAAMGGELDFTSALEARVALLAGQPVALLEAAWLGVEMMPGAEALVATCRAGGIATSLVSGGFHIFADRVAERLGFEQVAANRLGTAGDRLTGKVARPVLDRDAKRRILERRCIDLGIRLAETVAVGDGANDLAMLGVAGLGVAFHAKPAVAAVAAARIDHGDLRTLLYFLGFRADEIVTESVPRSSPLRVSEVSTIEEGR